MEPTQFWVVWNEMGQSPMVKHSTAESAEREAERLARAHGGTFHVLALMASATRMDVTWRRVTGDTPF